MLGKLNVKIIGVASFFKRVSLMLLKDKKYNIIHLAEILPLDLHSLN